MYTGKKYLCSVFRNKIVWSEEFCHFTQITLHTIMRFYNDFWIEIIVLFCYVARETRLLVFFFFIIFMFEKFVSTLYGFYVRQRKTLGCKAKTPILGINGIIIPTFISFMFRFYSLNKMEKKSLSG